MAAADGLQMSLVTGHFQVGAFEQAFYDFVMFLSLSSASLRAQWCKALSFLPIYEPRFYG